MRVEERRRREAAQDRVLLRIGAAAAIFAAIGATVLNLRPGEPGLRSLENLALFAQPSRGRPEREQPPRFAAPATPSPRLAANAPQVPDPNTVGAIGEEPAPPPGRHGATPLGAWRVYDVLGERVLLGSPTGVVWAEPGVDLGAAGVVARVDMGRDGISVVTSRGQIRR